MYMYQHSRLKTNRLGFFQKFRNFDYILLFCILLLGFISLATMYSTDGGEVLFHTRSHFTKFVVFILMMLIISFINIKYWFALGYLSYLVIIESTKPESIMGQSPVIRTIVWASCSIAAL